MGERVFQVDAFTGEAFSGNPAAVVLLEREAETGWMQRVAAEMNLSETAFVRRVADAFELRWFTPTVEVELCGHATLATAATLWEVGWAARDQPIAFDTIYSGRLTARQVAGKGEGWIELDFPARDAELLDDAAARSIGFDWKTMLGEPIVRLGRAGEDLLAEMTDAQTVRHLQPDLRLLAGLPGRGVIVTAKAEAGADHDFVSRFFAPAAGVDEDPVTGSAHCALGPWWAKRLGRDELVGYQASKRGGRVSVRMQGGRVMLGGQTVMVMEGRMCDV